MPDRQPLVPDAVRTALLELPGRAGGAVRVEVLARCPSTSTALADAVRRDPGAWPDRSVLVADHQVAGRGRAGRSWTTPPGAALTFSVLLRPPVPPARWGWLPLLGGLAVVQALATLGAPAVLKWPNDVLVPAVGDEPGWGEYRKVAGVLGEAVADLPGGPALVLGIGINVDQSPAELPVPSAGSLALAGVGADRTAVLREVVGRLVDLDERWRGTDGDAAAAGLADACAAACVTLGNEVVASLPGGRELAGRAVALATDGALVVAAADGEHTLHAGDVRLRTVARGPRPPQG